MINLTRIFKNTIFTSQKLAKDYYRVLGLTKTASEKQIKDSYYNLAKKFHPDVNKDPQSQTAFADISIAYQILSNASKKAQYDQKHSSKEQIKKQKPRPFSSFYKSQKKTKAKYQSDDFEPFEGYDPYFGRNKHHKKAKRGQDININVTISLTQSVKGIKKQILYIRKIYCDSCKDKVFQSCYPCGGKGKIYDRKSRQKNTCINCKGIGYQNNCSQCHGRGQKTIQVNQSIAIQSNTHDKTILRVKGNGHQGFRHDNGDLFVTVFVQQTQDLKIDGNNVYSEHCLDYITAILGGKTHIQTVHGAKQIEVQAGTQSGTTIRLFNHGLISAFSKRKGDHIVTFKIKIPQQLNQKQKSLLQQLKIQ